jgi:hypothetical protein
MLINAEEIEILAKVEATFVAVTYSQKYEASESMFDFRLKKLAFPGNVSWPVKLQVRIFSI